MATAEECKRLTELAFGQMAGQAVAMAAGLGLADLIGTDERTGAELAEKTGADPATLTRFLRALAALEVLTEVDVDTFRLTGVGELLRADRPDSLLGFVQAINDQILVAAWRELGGALRTGRKTFDTVFDGSFYEYLAANPEKSARFNAGMDRFTVDTARALVAGFDLSRFGTVLDIGGGNGALLSAVLAAQPALKGILFDTEAGMAESAAALTATGVTDRCARVTGDFLAAVPAGADLHLAKSVLHNWRDDDAVTILRNSRRALPSHGRLLIIESVLPDVVDGSAQPSTYLLDLAMLVNVDGLERTRADFERLCARAGFGIAGIHRLPALSPAPYEFSFLECVCE
jgi:ubiquinone/menaquinone biosynthesis C-methylase UbiE